MLPVVLWSAAIASAKSANPSASRHSNSSFFISRIRAGPLYTSPVYNSTSDAPARIFAYAWLPELTPPHPTKGILPLVRAYMSCRTCVDRSKRGAPDSPPVSPPCGCCWMLSAAPMRSVLFQLMYPLGHPENYTFLFLRILVIGLTYPEIFNLPLKTN